MTAPVTETYTPFSRWAPRTALYWALRPQKALRRLRGASVPLAVRVRSCGDPRVAGLHSLVWWSYDPQALGERLHLTFESGAQLTNFDARWRVVAAALWRLIQKHPAVTFHDVAVDLGDGWMPRTPEGTFVFARRLGGTHPLLPNPYLLMERKPVPAALPWAAKTDRLYFRGADSGSPDLEENTRVALCRAAASLPDADCKLTRLVQGSPEFRAQLEREGLVGRRVSIPEMNRHRFLVDTDGNTTSWDRYLLIGTFGAVPILFESAWEECWHGDLVEGENCLRATRATLGAVLEQLRADTPLARHLAEGASALVARRLSPEGAQAMFEAAWLERIRG
jgi:hypothetical protein